MTAPRKPQDRAPKKSEQVAAEVTRPDGWDLLKPFAEIPVWEQTDLIEIVQEVYDESEEDGDDTALDLAVVGKLAKKLVDFAIDPAAYQAFVSGPGAIERAAQLGVAYAQQLGESERSAT